ncbi:hypothetical protein ARTHRO9AX_130029 [Arthrobacter sp. 9AX]|nr:hypothetical protein ARTHRO9AX_130029 [Arthrobacter sp. 9AX]
MDAEIQQRPEEATGIIVEDN